MLPAVKSALRSPRTVYLQWLIFFTVLYPVSARLTEVIAGCPGAPAAIWLPGGVAFAAYVLLGYRAWPAVMAGALLVNPAVLNLGDSFALALALASATTLSGAAGLFAARLAGGLKPQLSTMGEVGRLCLGSFVMATLAATLVSAIFYSTGRMPAGHMEAEWACRCLSVLAGTLIFGPPVLTWSHLPRLTLNWRRAPEALAVSAAVLAVGYFILAGHPDSSPVALQLEYLFLPLGAVLALRFNHREETLALLVIACFAGWGSARGLGPFTHGTTLMRVVMLDLFLLVGSIMTLTLGAANSMRKESEAARRSGDLHFRDTFEQSAVGLCHVSPEGTFIRVNAALCGIIGYPAEELIRLTFGEITHPEDLDADWASARALLRGEISTYSMVKRYLHKAGHLVWVELSVSLVRTDLGQPNYFISVIADVTQRVETEQKLHVAEEKFRRAVESSPIGVVESLVPGRIRRANSAFCQMVGWEPDELLAAGVDLAQLTPPEKRELTRGFVQAALRTGNSGLFEKEYLRRDGTPVPVAVAISIHPDSPDQALVFVVDLTELKETETQLRISEGRMRAAQDAAQFGVFDLNVLTGELNWSEGSYLLYGLEPGTIITPELHTSLIVPEDRDLVNEALARALEGDTSYTEYRILRGDGEVWISSKGRYHFDQEGLLSRFIGVSVNINERKLAELAVREASSQLRQMADAMPQIVWTGTADGHTVALNERWYEFSGFSRGLTGNESWGPILHRDDLQPCLDRWQMSVESGEPFDMQYRFFDRSTGEYRWFLGRGVPIRDSNGEVIRWVGTATDIDDHKRLSDELERRVERRTGELQQSLREQTILLKELHHRVKNNLQVICSLLSMQMDCVGGTQFAAPLLDAYQRVQSIALVHERLYQSETLAELDFSAYVAILARDLFHVYCVDSVRVDLKLEAEPISLSIEQAIPCGLILNELLSNSLKHAFPAPRTGTILVSYKRAGDRLELSVSDDGVGLPESFEVRQTRSLGFQVVCALTSQLCGELDITSQSGSRISVSWPAPEESVMTAGSATGNSGVRPSGKPGPTGDRIAGAAAVPAILSPAVPED